MGELNITEELKELHGRWELVRAEEDGREVDLTTSILPTRVIFSSKQPADLATRCDVYSVTINPSVEPKRLDATVTGGEVRGTKMLGIYRLQDRHLFLKLHFGARDYPLLFPTKNGDGTFLLELRRKDV